MNIRYTVEKIYPWLYRLHDPYQVYSYLVIGEDKALLYDTGHGIGDISGVIREITAKPLTIVLGHGHIDHANGAYQFDEVYLHERDFELFRTHTSPEYRDTVLKGLAENNLIPDFDTEVWCNEQANKLVKLEYGTVFDLGGLHVEVINMAGHTAGSVGLLIAEKHTLLVSDAANGHIWMFLNESLSLRQYIKMLERVSQLDFDVYFAAHSNEERPKSDFGLYIKAARNATIEKAMPYDTFPELNPFIYTEDGVSIVFCERTLYG